MLSFFVCRPAAVGDEFDQYFEALRHRQLFVLAETACEVRLADPDLPADDRIRYSLELSRTLTEHARLAGPEEQQLQWERAAQVLTELLASPEAAGQKPRLQVQLALIAATRGESLRWRSLLSPWDAALRDQARRGLQTAIGQLRALETDLRQRVQDSRRSRIDRGELAPHELRQLEYNVRFRLGTCLLDLAELYPASDAERIGSVIEADEIFRRFSGGPDGERMTLLGSILLARCYRLRGEYERIDESLKKLEEQAESLQLLEVLTAERARARLAAGHPTEAAQLLIDYRRQRGELPGELQFLRLRSLIDAWKIARQLERQELSQQLLEQIRDEARIAQVESGAFWGQRCLQLLNETETTQTYGGELAAQVRKATAFYASGELGAAITGYEQAAQWAAEHQQPDRAAELWQTAGSIAIKDQRYSQAAELFQRVYDEFPDLPLAAQAHLLRAYCLGVIYDQERTADSRLIYTAALDQHVQRYPSSPTAAEAHWMRGRLLERRLQYTKALQHYQAIAADAPRAVDAAVHLARCYEAILSRLEELERDPTAWREAAIAQLGQTVDRWPTVLAMTLGHREVLVRLARIQMSPPADYDRASQLLARASSGTADEQVPESQQGYLVWLNTLRVQMQIVALAGQGRIGDASQLVSQLADDNPVEVLQVLDGLSRVARNQSLDIRRSLGELQLATASSLAANRSQLSPAQQLRLDRCLGEALMATNQPRRAVELFETLVEQSPRDAALLEQAAQVMVQVDDPARAAQAQDLWRRIETLHPDGSLPWIRARYHTIACAANAGRVAEARKLLAVTRLLYPQLGTAEWRQRYTDLASELPPEGRTANPP